MLKDKWLTISIFVLAFSILLSGLWIRSAIRDLSMYQVDSPAAYNLSNSVSELSQVLRQANSNSTSSSARPGEITSLLTNPDSMYLAEAAKYLSITKDELSKIIDDPNSEIPYLKMSDNLYIFNKNSLDKWLEKSYIMP